MTREAEGVSHASMCDEGAGDPRCRRRPDRAHIFPTRVMEDKWSSRAARSGRERPSDGKAKDEETTGARAGAGIPAHERARIREASCPCICKCPCTSLNSLLSPLPPSLLAATPSSRSRASA